MCEIFSDFFEDNKGTPTKYIPKYTACMAVLLFEKLRKMDEYNELIYAKSVDTKKCRWSGYNVPINHEQQDNIHLTQLPDGTNHCLLYSYRFFRYDNNPSSLISKTTLIRGICKAMDNYINEDNYDLKSIELLIVSTFNNILAHLPGGSPKSVSEM